ncbi:MAG: class I SAM-dependent methyltransferase [Patescibacteria group bacterium]
MNEGALFPVWLLVLCLVGAFLLARWFGGFTTGAPFVPLKRRYRADGYALADVCAEDVVMDLGSGDGRLLRPAAEAGAEVIGWELNPLLVWYTRFRFRRWGKRAAFYRGNLLRADLSRATVLFVFQMPKFMPQVATLIRTQARPGTRIVSFAFALPGFELIEQRGIAKFYRV